MIRNVISLAALFIAAIILCGTASAQTRIGTIQGTVKDPNSAVVVGAQVVIRNEATGETYTITVTGVGTGRISNQSNNVAAVERGPE